MSLKNSILLFVFFLIITRIACMCYEKPSYNWDTLAYMAIVLDVEQDDITKIHQATYRIAQAEIPNDKYTLITDTSHAVKKNVLNNPDKFFQYTSFFRVKPFYIALSYLTYKIGVPLSKAPIIPSVLSFIAISILLAWSFTRTFSMGLALLLSLCIMVSPPVLEAARLATPDALSTFILLFVCYLLLRSTSWAWIFIFLSMSILVRLDNIVFAIIVLCFQFFRPMENDTRKIPWFVFLGLIILWAFAAFLIMKYANIENGFEEFYGGLSKKINPITVIKEAVIGLNTVQTSQLSIILAISAIILFYKKQLTFKSLNPQQYLFLILMSYLVVRYVMFPDLTTRFYLPVYIMSAALALESIPSLIMSQLNSKE